MKQCKDCKLFKDESEFYGAQGECKSCTKLRVKAREKRLSEDPAWIIKQRERHRKKYHRLNYKSKKKKPTDPNSHRRNFPEKYKANSVASKIPCSKNHHKHHWSYNKEHWKDVIILPVELHYKIHRFMIYDQEFLMYRTLENKLLDTRELHESYIQQIIPF